MAYEILPCLYDLEKDLQARIHGTLCRYNNIPVYVQVRSAKELWLYEPVSMNRHDRYASDKAIEPLFKIRPTDPLFDISSPELGYINFDYDAEVAYLRASKNLNRDHLKIDQGLIVFFIKRNPLRQWQQGISTASLRFEAINGKSHTTNLIPQQIIYSEGMMEMIKGTYPTLPEAVHRLSRLKDVKYKTVAVSKEVALEKTDSDIIQVYVKKNNVGYILPNERTIHLKKDDYSWITRKILTNLKTSIV